jgi:hypothetical protein
LDATGDIVPVTGRRSVAAMSDLSVPPPADARPATAGLQAAIDRAAASGGGRVTLAGGATYVSGTLELRSGIELHLPAGTVLRGSAAQSDYRAVAMAGRYGGNAGAFLIIARDADGVAITGEGTIDGNAGEFLDGWWTDDGPWIRRPRSWRPRGVGFFGCRRVRIRDVLLRDMAQWTLHLTGCVDVLVQGITIRNGLDVPNCDGIDPDHCRGVRIIGCHIEAGDDGIVLKNTAEYRDYGPTEDVLISQCTVVSTSAAIKIGTESVDSFRGIVVTGCAIRRSHRGLAIQLRDGGDVEDVLFSDCVVETRLFCPRYWGRAEPVYLTAWPREDGGRVGRVRQIRCRNLLCRGEHGIFVHGHPSRPIEDVVFDGVRHELAKTSRWPAGQHDLRPAGGAEHGGLRDDLIAGFHLQHVRGVRLRDCAVAWQGEPPACYGPALCCRDVTGLEVTSPLGAAARPGEPPVVDDG